MSGCVQVSMCIVYKQSETNLTFTTAMKINKRYDTYMIIVKVKRKKNKKKTQILIKINMLHFFFFQFPYNTIFAIIHQYNFPTHQIEQEYSYKCL